jgi:CBS domain-containing protein
MKRKKVRRTFWDNSVFANLKRSFEGVANVFNQGGPMKISDIMTRNPVWVNNDTSIRLAKRTMSEKGIKHLPVLDKNNQVVGILSDRDIKLQQALSDGHHFHENAIVTDASVKSPYCVSPSAPAAKVLRHMHQKRIGSTVIAQGGTLMGIFTSMDACRVLAELLEQD